MNNLVQIFTAENISGLTWLLMFGAAFSGGVIASVSPCSLAMLPLMIGYVGGCSKETPFRTFIQLSCFILGTAIVFTIIGVICAVTGSVFASALGGYFTLIMASLLLVIGLKITEILDFEIPVIIKSMPQNKTNSLVLYPVLLGIAFALAGTPCSTPILFLFAIGQGLILILAGIFTSTVKNIKKFSGITDKLVKMSGWLIIIVSIYLYYRVFMPLF